MEYSKDYKNWMLLKEDLEKRNSKPPYYKEGDIWWISMGINIGYEMDGKNKTFTRPVLIIKKYNHFLFLGVALSTQIKADNPYYNTITIEERRVSYISSQLRSYSSKRLHNKIGELKESLYLSAKYKIMEENFAPLPFLGKGRG